jgi:hypothetical protein
MGAMLASNGERLAGWTTRDEINLALELPEVNLANIGAENLPTTDSFDFESLILSDRVAAIQISLDDADWFESGTVQADPESSSSRE